MPGSASPEINENDLQAAAFEYGQNSDRSRPNSPQVRYDGCNAPIEKPLIVPTAADLYK